ncbi:MAG: hypothetical protein ACI4CS_06480 [Candidatus Weimeria sp.]
MPEELSVYDASKTYDNEILPLVEQIKQICAVKEIPFFFTCAVKNSDKGTEYKNEGVLTGSYGINLKTDNFAPILGVMNGGRVVFTEDEDDALSGELSDMLSDDDGTTADHNGASPSETDDDDDITVIGEI